VTAVPKPLAATHLVFVNERGSRIGEGHQRAKLDDTGVAQVLMLHHEARLSYQAIADKFDDVPGGISKETVRDIIKGRRRAQIPYAVRRVPKRS